MWEEQQRKKQIYKTARIFKNIRLWRCCITHWHNLFIYSIFYVF